MGRQLGWIVSITLLLVTGLSALNNGRAEFDAASTRWQRTVWLGEILYGMLGLVAGAGLVRRRAWSVTVSAAWAGAVTYVATVASFAFHDPAFSQPGTVTGTVAAGIGTATVASLVVWAARVATRAPKLPQRS